MKNLPGFCLLILAAIPATQRKDSSTGEKNPRLWQTYLSLPGTIEIRKRYARSRKMILLLNKPFRVLCQFTDAEGRPTLARYVPREAVYPAGRLDYDSEGLVVLTDDGGLQARIAHPRHGMTKVYWAQVEGVPDEHALSRLRRGVEIGERRTRPAAARIIEAPAGLWPRDPPIRYRKSVPDTWLEITLKEGRNRQVRRMTAAVGHPTLRLIRCAVGPWGVAGLAPGEWREASLSEDRGRR